MIKGWGRPRTRPESVRRSSVGVEALDGRRLLSGMGPLALAHQQAPAIVHLDKAPVTAQAQTASVPSQRLGVTLLRVEGKALANAVERATNWHFAMYLFRQSLQSNPPDIVLGNSNHPEFVAQITRSPEFAQVMNSVAMTTPVGHTVSGTTTARLRSTNDLFLALDEVTFTYTVRRTDASHYTTNVVVSDRYTFPPNVFYALTPIQIIGWTVNDIAAIFQTAGVIQPYNVRTDVVHVGGNLSTHAITIQGVG
jgi:hypothetical protein